MMRNPHTFSAFVEYEADEEERRQRPPLNASLDKNLEGLAELSPEATAIVMAIVEMSNWAKCWVALELDFPPLTSYAAARSELLGSGYGVIVWIRGRKYLYPTMTLQRLLLPALNSRGYTFRVPVQNASPASLAE